MTGVLALLAMAIVSRVVPDPVISRFHSDTEASAGKFHNVLRNGELLRLDFGVFALHAVLMALWLVVPLSLRTAGLAADQHWEVYFPVLLISMVLVVPAIIYGEKKAKLKQVFVISIGVLLLSQAMMAYAFDSLWGMAMALLVFFAAFNLLEATLPSLISKIAPVGAKGTAIGVYSSVQFLGTFVGASVGGYLFQHYGSTALFAFCGALLLSWLMFAITMKAPAAVRTRMYHVEKMDTGKANGLSRELASLPGVHEALVLASEGVAYLKVDMRGFDEQSVVQLLGGKA